MAERGFFLFGKGEAGRIILRNRKVAARLGQRRHVRVRRRQIVVQERETLQYRHKCAEDRGEHAAEVADETAHGAFADDDNVIAVDFGIYKALRGYP